MYQKILVAVDNGPLSDACCRAAVSLARAFGAQVVGCHVYAARLHERRFRQMEATLPKEYMADDVLGRQRAIHNKLITLGLRLISESYLDSLERRCQAAGVPFSRKTFDGRNWERLVEDINASDYDLVVMGARGHGTNRADAVGSVCLRVLRRTRIDTLVIKYPDAFQDETGKGIMVAIDGSPEAFGALQTALALGRAYGQPVQAVAAYDPHFHYAVFHRMVQALSAEAARVFRFKEQERLHAQIIDTGLAHLYQTHLEVAQRIAETEGTHLSTALLAGRPADELLAYAAKTRPWLWLTGRIGMHSGEEMDLGSVTEHLLRLAPCNLLISSRQFRPPLDVWERSALRWTEEAEALLGAVPGEHRSALRQLVHRLALEQEHTVVTKSLVYSALEVLRPSPGEMQRIGEAALSVAMEALGKEPGTVYLCPECSYYARGARPSACPRCQSDGETFLAVEPETLAAIASARGNVAETPAFDNISAPSDELGQE